MGSVERYRGSATSDDLTNARGLLPNDRTHMLRLMGAFDVPRTGFVVAGNLQYFTGKPWAASTQVSVKQGDQRILLETRGTRRNHAERRAMANRPDHRSAATGRTARNDAGPGP